jgi:hypothetical protein
MGFLEFPTVFDGIEPADGDGFQARYNRYLKIAA